MEKQDCRYFSTAFLTSGAQIIHSMVICGEPCIVVPANLPVYVLAMANMAHSLTVIVRTHDGHEYPLMVNTPLLSGQPETCGPVCFSVPSSDGVFGIVQLTATVELQEVQVTVMKFVTEQYLTDHPRGV